MQKSLRLKIINILLIVFIIVAIATETFQIIGLIKGWTDTYWQFISTTILIISNLASILAIRILVKRSEN